ncbi:succinylglutamate desuccinylase/aspartoacylase family protein [Undibacterium terreum]|uniref:Succinylglutamate desuccinylase/aspartoacylase n=1 Tax=Undibacterium terreum TaxID=1224302 RepID=A0A916UU00_9BURK|nr:succinylglutamate desuccinylase/aspartoacylase family protein [Undibacterium terreum]GGC84922.1 succinylglutamate desuccinylase/aspartoacylase [Undibacterium terreum]
MRIEYHSLPSPSSNSEKQLQSLHFGHAGIAPQTRKVYIQASLHADEIPGMLVAQHLRQRLELLEAEGRLSSEIVLVPVANPVGLAQVIQGTPFGRFDLSSGINFNRGYRNLVPQLKTILADKLGSDSADNVNTIRSAARQLLMDWQPVSETETLKKTLLMLSIDADIVLDLHCDNESVLHLYTGTPLAEAAMPLSRLLGAQALLLATESGDDPFDETCGRIWWELAEHFAPDYPVPLACMPVTVELRGQVDVSHALAKQDAEALIAFLVHTGHIEKDAQGEKNLPPALCKPTPLEGVEPLVAAHAGIVVFSKLPGDAVKQGDSIAELIDPVSGVATSVKATVSGKLFARIAHRYVHKGTTLAKIAGEVAYRSGKLLSP